MSCHFFSTCKSYKSLDLLVIDSNCLNELKYFCRDINCLKKNSRLHQGKSMQYQGYLVIR